MLLYDDPDSGLMVERGRGRPPKDGTPNNNSQDGSNTMDEGSHHYSCTQEMRAEINSLRKSLSFSRNSKLVLLLSIASDSMIELVMMFPEVFFMDVTGCVNRQKRDFFLMAIKDAAGKVFTGNLTSIPSGKSWVFLTIFSIVFPFLYGKETIKRNRLALTDEDIAEYQTFTSCIKSDEHYKNSTLGLCSFHALWKPYKSNVKPFLPKTSATVISTIGKEYGK